MEQSTAIVKVLIAGFYQFPSAFTTFLFLEGRTGALGLQILLKFHHFIISISGDNNIVPFHLW